MTGLAAQVQPRVLLLALSVALALAALAAWLYLFKAPLAEYAHLRHTRAVSAQELRRESKGVEAARIASLERRVHELRHSLYGESGHLSPGEMVSAIIGRLDRLCDRHGIQLVGVTPGAPARVLMFEEMPFDVEVSGSYFNIYAWLEDATRALRPMVVKQFHIQSAQRNGALRMVLRVVSYRATDPRP